MSWMRLAVRQSTRQAICGRVGRFVGGSCQPSSEGEFGSCSSKLALALSKLLVA